MSSVDSYRDEVDNIPDVETHRIGVDKLSNRSGKQAKLLDPADGGFSYHLRRKWHEFLFSENIFCKTLTIVSADNDLKGMEVVVTDYAGIDVKEELSVPDGNVATLRIHKVIKKISVKPAKKWLGKVMLKEIMVDGYGESDFYAVQKSLLEYERVRGELDAYITKVGEREGDIRQREVDYENGNEERRGVIEGLKGEVEELREEVDGLELHKSKLTESVNKLESREKSLNQSNESVSNNVSQLQSKAKQLNEQISNITEDLRKLDENKNIFAYEIEEYVKQGNIDIRRYLALSIIPWTLISYVTYLAFNGAADLTVILSGGEDVNIWDVLISRVPFMMIAGAIIIVSYEFSKIFVKRIIDIHKQKLAFSRIGIIAKDVTYASVGELELSDAEVFELRTKLKMDMLKSHLKGLVDDDYSYEINPSIIELYKNRIVNKRKNPVNNGGEDEMEKQ